MELARLQGFETARMIRAHLADADRLIEIIARKLAEKGK